MKLFQLTATFSLILTTSCATEYTCGQFPSSGCQPISKVYEKSNGEVYDYREDLYAESQAKKNNDIGNARSKRLIIKSNDTVKESKGPDSKSEMSDKEFRTRILIGAWTDNDNDLHEAEYVYINKKDKTWLKSIQP